MLYWLGCVEQQQQNEWYQNYKYSYMWIPMFKLL